jgi:hypothetical protein
MLSSSPWTLSLSEDISFTLTSLYLGVLNTHVHTGLNTTRKLVLHKRTYTQGFY